MANMATTTQKMKTTKGYHYLC